MAARTSPQSVFLRAPKMVNIKFLHLSGRLSDHLCANNLVVDWDDALVNMYESSFNGGKFALENKGVDIIVRCLSLRLPIPRAGGCVLQKGGDWYSAIISMVWQNMLMI